MSRITANVPRPWDRNPSNLVVDRIVEVGTPAAKTLGVGGLFVRAPFAADTLGGR